MLQQQINQIRRFLSNAQTPDSVIAHRLLSEAEWEYVTRAGTTTIHNVGDDITKQQANFDNQNGPVSVGQYPPNAFGLYDLHGNVMEWVQDCWDFGYSLDARRDGSPREIEGCKLRVLRGGHWGRTSKTGGVGSARRDHGEINARYNDAGFRVAKTLSQQ